MAAWSLNTNRTLLREWRRSDAEDFARLNSDPAVMEMLGGTMSRDESDRLLDRFIVEHQERSYCPWALESLKDGALLGFVGLHDVNRILPFFPATEVGWRLHVASWGQGLATEAATAAVAYGFSQIALTEIVSMTAVINGRSRRVMERLGMTTSPTDNFEHPSVAAASPLRPHVLYRLAAPQARVLQ